MAKKNKKVETVVTAPAQEIVLAPIVESENTPVPVVGKPGEIRFDAPPPARGKVREPVMELVRAWKGDGTVPSRTFHFDSTKATKTFQIGVFGLGSAGRYQFKTKVDGNAVTVWYLGPKPPKEIETPAAPAQ